MISFGSCIYPTLGSVKVSPSRIASPENYQHQMLKVSGVTPRPELPPITLWASDYGLVQCTLAFSWSIKYVKVLQGDAYSKKKLGWLARATVRRIFSVKMYVSMHMRPFSLSHQSLLASSALRFIIINLLAILVVFTELWAIYIYLSFPSLSLSCLPFLPAVLH